MFSLYQPMTLVWLDDHGQRVPKRPCLTPKCDREWPVYRHRLRFLIMAGWKPMKLVVVVNWWSRTAVHPMAGADGYWALVPLIGEAT